MGHHDDKRQVHASGADPQACWERSHPAGQYGNRGPYHSWERGANENTNGLIRQYIPKGTDFSELTDEMLAEIEWKLNHRPRKSLGYRTPLEYCKQLFNFNF